MHFTATDIIVIIGALSTGIINVITSWKTHTKVNETFVKTAVIESNTNGDKTRATEQLISLKRENDILRGVISEKDKIAAVLAAKTEVKS